MLFFCFCALSSCVVGRRRLACLFAFVSQTVWSFTEGAMWGGGGLHHFVFLCFWGVHENSAPLYQVIISANFCLLPFHFLVNLFLHLYLLTFMSHS